MKNFIFLILFIIFIIALYIFLKINIIYLLRTFSNPYDKGVLNTVNDSLSNVNDSLSNIVYLLNKKATNAIINFEISFIQIVSVIIILLLIVDIYIRISDNKSFYKRKY